MKIPNFINQFEHIVIVSPHLDDAVFSAGSLLKKLVKAKKEVTYLNVFTSASNHTSLSALMFLLQSKHKSTTQLYKDRVAEDKQVLKSIGLTPNNLQMVDALWRPKENIGFLGRFLAEFALVYPTYRFHILSGRVSKNDIHTQSDLVEKIREYSNRPKTLILGPAGIGGHVDHVLVRQAIEKTNLPYALWIDVPYNKRTGFVFNSYQKEHNHLSIKLDKKEALEKLKLCQGYHTQYSAVFGQSSPEFNQEDLLLCK